MMEKVFLILVLLCLSTHIIRAQIDQDLLIGGNVSYSFGLSGTDASAPGYGFYGFYNLNDRLLLSFTYDAMIMAGVKLEPFAIGVNYSEQNNDRASFFAGVAYEFTRLRPQPNVDFESGNASGFALQSGLVLMLKPWLTFTYTNTLHAIYSESNYAILTCRLGLAYRLSLYRGRR